MEAAFGRLHNNGGAAFGGPPIVVESIMVDGEVANIGKTYANMYRIFMYMYISHILIYFPYVIPGAISLAKSGCLSSDKSRSWSGASCLAMWRETSTCMGG